MPKKTTTGSPAKSPSKPSVKRAASSGVTSRDLFEQSEALRRQAEALKAKEFVEVVKQIKAAIDHYGITAKDLGFGGEGRSAGKTTARKKPAAARKARAGYEDASGNKWSGYGPRPQWLKDALEGGVSLESLQVRQSA